MTVFRPLATRAELDAVIDASHTAPVILFKHSQSCGVSHMAKASLALGEVPVVHQVVVQQARDVSDAIADQLGVRHQSPQVLVVSGGTAAWHTSHAGVTARRVADAVRRAGDALTPLPVVV